MRIKDLTITDQNVQSVHVQSQPDRLTGTAQQNKAVFDALPKLIIQRFNLLLEALAGTGGAGEIPVGPIEGVTAENVQQALAAIQQNLTAYIDKIKSAVGASEVGFYPVGGMTAQNVQQALAELRTAIDNIVAGIIPGGSITPDMIAGPIPPEKGGTGATTAQAALAALGAGVRDNLFFNGNFSIWQHYPDGRYTGVPNNNYIADGFMMLSGDGSIPNTFERQHGGGIKFVSGPPARIKRRISNAERFNGKRMTLSCWKSQGYYEQTITAIDWNDETDVIGCFSEDELIWIRPGQTFYWMKIEEGEGQTLFYQDDSGDYHLLPQPESDYAAQLAKCQSTLLHLGGEIAIRASYANPAGIWFFVPTPVTLRSVPIIIGTLVIRTVDGGTVYNDYTFNCENFSDNGVFVRAIKAGGNTLTDAVLTGDAYLSAEF